jgi:antirestriction protein ArdC/DNA repair protein RadC
MQIKDIQQQEISFGAIENKVLKVPEIELSFTASKVEMPDAIINSSSMVADFIRSLYEVGKIELQERFTVLFLNRKNKVIGFYKHSIGSHTATVVDENMILSAAIQSLSSSIILSHNHPSGNTQPSQQDINLTNKFQKQFKVFNINILDHVIVTSSSHYSFADEGRLNGISGFAGFIEDNDIYEGIPFLTPQQEKELGIEQDYSLGKASGRDAIYKMVNERIIKLIKDSKNLFWRKTWTDKEVDDGKPNSLLEFGRSFSTGKLYSGINFWSVNIDSKKNEKGEIEHFLRKTNHPFWLTPKQISQQGGKIKKGAKTEIIVYYIKHYSLFGKGISPEYYWQIMKECGKNPNDNRCDGLHAYSAMKYYRVINQKDISGVDFESKSPKIKRIKPLNNDDKIKASELIIELMPNSPSIKYGGANAFYASGTDIVQVPKQGQFESINEYYGAIFHELIHSTGHKSRIGREFGRKGTKEYAFEELIAELGASYLNAESGILFNNLKNSSAYIKSWNSRLVKEMEEDFTFFFKASSQGQKAANYILNIDENGVPEFYKHLEIKEDKQEVKRRIRDKEKRTKALRIKAKAIRLKLVLSNI